jgi:hypothetical protein
MLFFFWKGGGGCEFFLFFIWFSLRGDCEGPKVVLFYSLTWVSHMERTLRGTLLFWFSLEGSCGGPKRVLFFSCPRVGHMDITLEINFCLGLVCKVVVEVQRSSIFFFPLRGVCHMYRNLEVLKSLLIS